MSRRWLRVAVVLALVAGAGCASVFTDIPEDQLCPDDGEEYDWDTQANATYTLTEDANYRAVYNVSGTDELELYYTTALGNDRPIEVENVGFVGADGTEYDCADIEVETTRTRTIVELPAEDGTFAYTASSTPKRFGTLVLVEGSHEVILPEGRELSNPLFGNVQPAATEIEREDGRVHVRWDDVDSERLVVQYYMERDLTLFFGLVVVTGLGATAGIVYYYRLVRELRKRREEAGLDVDVDDDEFGRDPPPGMG